MDKYEKYFYSKKMLIFIYLPVIFSFIMSWFMIYSNYSLKAEPLDPKIYGSLMMPLLFVSLIFMTFHKEVRRNHDKISKLEEKIKKIENLIASPNSDSAAAKPE